MLRLLAATFLVLGFSMAVAPQTTEAGGDKAASYIKVKAKGKLMTGIAAIGGETTGTILRTKDATVELDFGKNQKLRTAANKLNRKDVIVEGQLTIRRGVEIRMRIIVKVTKISAAN